jgi:methylmalonyl-CoA epimerase
VRLDHVGIAVRDLEAGLRLYTEVFGGRLVHRETLAGEGVQLVFVDMGGTLVELLAPTTEDGPLAKFLEARGEGLHHLAFEVADLNRALAEAVDKGLRPVTDGPRHVPRPGSRSRVIAFLHPAALHGVLIELVQRAP